MALTLLGISILLGSILTFIIPIIFVILTDRTTIPIEERNEEEVSHVSGSDEDGNIVRVRLTPKESQTKNPAFDVTPAKYITGIITEKGIIKANKEEIKITGSKKRSVLK